MGNPRVSLAERIDELRRAHGDLNGPALLRALLLDGPLAGETVLVSSFGAESAALLDMVARIDRATPVIFLDTGKLFAETHAHRQALVEALRLRDVRVVGPEAATVARHDPRGDLWQRDPDGCCHMRKTAVLEAALAGFAAWITGRKRFQGGLRWRLPTIEPEWATGRIKINPLAAWSAEDVERYRRRRRLPRHPLQERGYPSIGCVPCTRPVAPDEPQRAGRWEGLGKSECGIHLRCRAW